MKTYKEILEAFREANPDVPFREAQKKASDLFRDMKAAAAAVPGQDKEPPETKEATYVNEPLCNRIEGYIRGESGGGMDRFRRAINEFNLIDCSIEVIGKTGPNKHCIIKGPGIRVPVHGHILAF